jgi:hypothetical protein
VRDPVWQRVFALLRYLAALVVAAITLPLLALGPALTNKVLPHSWPRSLLETISIYDDDVTLVNTEQIHVHVHVRLRGSMRTISCAARGWCRCSGWPSRPGYRR